MPREHFVYQTSVHQTLETLTGSDILGDITVRKPVYHRSIICNVTTEQHLVVSVVQADTASRVSWHVHHGQLPVAQTDNVT